MSTAAPTNSCDLFRLPELEGYIEPRLGLFVDVGKALCEIRDRRLYAATHKSFEAYLAARWNMRRQTGYDYIKAAAVVGNVRSTVQALPSLTQAVELAVLAPAQQQEIAATMDFATTTTKEIKRKIRAIKTAGKVTNLAAAPKSARRTAIENAELKRVVIGLSTTRGILRGLNGLDLQKMTAACPASEVKKWAADARASGCGLLDFASKLAGEQLPEVYETEVRRAASEKSFDRSVVRLANSYERHRPKTTAAIEFVRDAAGRIIGIRRVKVEAVA